ncbi:hypothetical protein FOZ62_024552 [Perkinsus olseni]|uniref:Protein kinase domain-containing protein n=2 Tax=Perkinsus olseni TaxID=32597 RepID=A0A7J6TH37_PEROL|nr:hypothetical protein FOZ62_024552 [Perkinsus olseni]
MLPRGERSRPSTVKRRAPLFQVPSELDLLKAIVELLGTPSEQTWPEAASLPSFHEFAYLPEPDNWPREMFGDACKESEKLDEFLKSMLMLNPSARPSSAVLLEHDYFTSGHPSMASKEELAKALRPAEFGDGSVVGYENLVSSFGLTCSAYWFVRYATCAQRCFEVVLRAFLGTDEDPGQLGSFIRVYCSDLLDHAWVGLSDPDISFEKLGLNESAATVIGIRTSLQESATFELDPEKIQSLAEALVGLLREKSISEKALSSLAGNNLQPYYGLLSVVRRRGFHHAPCPEKGEIYIVSKLFHAVVSGSKSFPPVGPIGDPRASLVQANQMLIMTDASLGAVGGIIALEEGAARSTAGSRRPVVWFQEKVSREVIGQWKGISADAQVPLESRDMVTLELLPVVTIFVDNEAARRILSKLYSRTLVLAANTRVRGQQLAGLLRNITQHLAGLVLSDHVVCRVASENNTIADKLSRSDASGIPQHWIRGTVEKEWMSAAK